MSPNGTVIAAIRVALTAFLATSFSIVARAQADYRLSPGDTVEIDVASMPDGAQRAAIQLDGTISIPEAGRIPVAGLTLAELQTRMESVLPTKMFHFRSPDGREQLAVITPGDITTAIVDYRPIYVTGDVLTPGQETYRPLMTVRQAIAISGGFSLLRARVGPTAVDPLDLRSDYESDWTDYLESYFHAERTRAELQNASIFDERSPADSPLPPDLAASIAQNEAQSLKVALNDTAQERAFLQKSLADDSAQIQVLLKQEQEEEDGVKADENEVALLTKLYMNGNLTNVRLSDSRRALLLSSTRELETTVELMQLRRHQADTARQIDREANQRQVALLTDLRNTNVRLAELGARLRAAGGKLLPLGAARDLPTASGGAGQPHVVVIRQAGTQWRRLPVDGDAEVLPGDVIEVTAEGGAGLAVTQ
jgi:polysaccharide biosynthesis/export protein